MSTDKASAAVREVSLSAGDLSDNCDSARAYAELGDFESAAKVLQWAEDNMRDAKRHLAAAIDAIDSARAAIAKAEQ